MPPDGFAIAVPLEAVQDGVMESTRTEICKTGFGGPQVNFAEKELMVPLSGKELLPTINGFAL